jgi:hypothetical protein
MPNHDDRRKRTRARRRSELEARRNLRAWRKHVRRKRQRRAGVNAIQVVIRSVDEFSGAMNRLRAAFELAAAGIQGGLLTNER